MLAVAYELKSPRVGEWTKQGWVEGLKSLGYVICLQTYKIIPNTSFRVDSIQGLKALLPKLRNQLGSDPKYFKKVYSHTFDFARNEGQRSLGSFPVDRPDLKYPYSSLHRPRYRTGVLGSTSAARSGRGSPIPCR
jgi:hypothetical protein